MNNSTIAQVMVKDPASISSEDSILNAVDLMKKHKIDHVTIVDQGKLVGIVSKTDLYKRLLKVSMHSSGSTYAQKELMTTPVAQIMTPDPVVVASNQSASFAAEILLQDVFHAIPVVDQGVLVGIVTARDVVRQLVDNE